MILMFSVLTHHFPCPRWQTGLLSAERSGVKVEPSEKGTRVFTG
jgi:hypothetical protein